MNTFLKRPLLGLALLLALSPAGLSAQTRVFISVDMEGIGGIGTSAMTSSSGKDYALGRQLMTEEVNTVVAAIFAQGPAEILVNDSHGDMRNLLHTQLDPRVEYIQGNIKPLGMVQGLDASFDAVIFIGYHARAGTEGGFLAHTGSGSVNGLWLNGTEVGEGGLNAFFAWALGVPVILATGDRVFTEQIAEVIPGVKTVAVKDAVGSQVARLVHPNVVNDQLAAATAEALSGLASARHQEVSEPVTVRMRFASTTRADILQAIPGMRRIDGFTVEIETDNMDRAYRVIRLMYKYVSW
ncbi:MAG: D-amino peptidase [Rhodothermales bacterium]|jgi:D-amino peptidase